jgi:hypothetical protein
MTHIIILFSFIFYPRERERDNIDMSLYSILYNACKRFAYELHANVYRFNVYSFEHTFIHKKGIIVGYYFSFIL